MTVHFAIVADRNIEIGLHVTIFSVLKNLSKDSDVVAHLFLKDYGESNLRALRTTLAEFGDRCHLQIYDARKLDSGTGKGLHGNKIPYLLFSIPDIVDTEIVLCLDADLLVTTDITPLFEINLNEKTVGAARSPILKYSWSKERSFLNSVGVSDESPYFNTGVFLVDTSKWRNDNIRTKCLEFASAYAENLHTADQTVLNAVLNGEVAFFPDNYNTMCFAEGPAAKIGDIDAIYHFVGSPKPWDIMGEFVHASYPAFQHYLRQTYFAGYKSYKNLSIFRLNRAIRIGRSYYRVFKSRANRRRSIAKA